MDHLILVRWPDLILINHKKRAHKIVDFAVLADHRVKLKESDKKGKYLNLGRELKKLWNIKVTFIPIVIGAHGTVTRGLIKGLEDLEIRGWVETIQNYYIIMIGQNTKKRPGDLWRLVFTQTSVKHNHQTWERCDCAREWNLTIQPNGICTNQNPS